MRIITYQCAHGHRVGLVLDGKLAEEVRARRARNKTCEVGIGGGQVCGAPAQETGETR